MESGSDIITMLAGLAAVLAMGFEFQRRRKRMHEIWDVLDDDEAKVGAALERMVASGELKPYVGPVASAA
jgi:hypothetical protein